MQDSKENNWQAGCTDHSKGNEQADTPESLEQHAASKGADSWRQYRQWISKVPAPRKRQSGIDPSVYTWKGYRNWSDQVKRDWSDEQ